MEKRVDCPRDCELALLAATVSEQLRSVGARMVTAESCSGGWIAKVCTDLAGSSAWFEGGFISYSNAAKQRQLGVPEALLQQHGAVSREVAKAMAQGAIAHSDAQVAVAVSGIAGPAGGTEQKRVGCVCFAWSNRNGVTISDQQQFAGGREAVRRQTVAHALRGILDICGTRPAANGVTAAVALRHEEGDVAPQCVE